MAFEYDKEVRFTCEVFTIIEMSGIQALMSP